MSNEALAKVAKMDIRPSGPALNTFCKNGMRSMKRWRIWQKTGGRCYYCGFMLEKDRGLWGESPADKRRMHVEHMTPLSEGGEDSERNLFPSCRTCNLQKRTYSVEDFRLRVSWRIAGIPLFSDDQKDWLAEHGFVFPDVKLVRFFGETLDD